MQKCLTLAVALSIVASAAAAAKNNNKPPAKNGNNKPPAVDVDCSAVTKKGQCQRAKSCLWDKVSSACLDESDVTCDMATTKGACSQIGCWFDAKAKTCIEKYDATCANAYSLKACRAVDAGCWYDRNNKVCADQEEKPVYAVDDPATGCPLKSKKKQCKIYENCAWRNKGKKCIMSPKLALQNGEE